MSSNALVSQGMTLAIGSAASPTIYTNITEVKSITGPSGNATVIDTTDLNSTAKEKRLGLKDQGQISFDWNYIPTDASHALVKAAFDSGAQTQFRLTFTDTALTKWYFSAFVNGFSMSNAVDGVVSGSVTLELTGSILQV